MNQRTSADEAVNFIYNIFSEGQSVI